MDLQYFSQCHGWTRIFRPRPTVNSSDYMVSEVQQDMVQRYVKTDMEGIVPAKSGN